MKPDEKRRKPRLIALLTIFLFLEVPGLILIGLNLLTRRWTFLVSFSVLWQDIQEAFRLMLATPGQIVGDEVLFYNLVGFFVMLSGAGAALLAGVVFARGRPIAWILSLFAQIAALLAGIGLYIVHQPGQSYWLIAIGVLMVLYLNNADVRQWFLKTWEGEV